MWTRVAVPLVAIALTGCSSTAQQDAEQAADDFVLAVAEQRAEDACALLAPRAVRDGDCASAISDLDALGDVGQTEVWGDGARAETGSSVMFLQEFAAGWRVTAAGCEGDGESPYECVIGGP